MTQEATPDSTNMATEALKRAEADLEKARAESSVPSLSIAKEEMELAKIWMQVALMAGGEGRRD